MLESNTTVSCNTPAKASLLSELRGAHFFTEDGPTHPGSAHSLLCSWERCLNWLWLSHSPLSSSQIFMPEVLPILVKPGINPPARGPLCAWHLGMGKKEVSREPHNPRFSMGFSPRPVQQQSNVQVFLNYHKCC